MDNPSTNVTPAETTPVAPVPPVSDTSPAKVKKPLNKPLVIAGVVIVIETLAILYLLFSVLNLTIRVRKLEGGPDQQGQQQQQTPDYATVEGPMFKSLEFASEFQLKAVTRTNFDFEIDHDSTVGPVLVVKVINLTKQQIAFESDDIALADDTVTPPSTDPYKVTGTITLSNVSTGDKLQFEVYEVQADSQGRTSEYWVYKQPLI